MDRCDRFGGIDDSFSFLFPAARNTLLQQRSIRVRS